MGEKTASNIKKGVEGKENICYVLITCQEPKENGSMQVELTYEGDTTLAAYLIQSAQGIFEEQMASE